ncbi:MAG: MBL fold metallo-hydrolase [Xanthomonadales bacterium]|nr:MBL fold metallo-hydrolase [Xanthomonadales bacterium]
MIKGISAGVLLAALAPFHAMAQLPDGFFDVELRTVPVAGNVYMIQRPDGFANVGAFVGEEGVLLVDSQFEPHAKDLVAAVRKITDGEIRFLVNTHVHPDHIGGNAPLAAEDVLIFAHDNMRVRMLERRSRFPRGNGGFFPQAPAAARPFVTYKDQITFHFNSEVVRVFLAPAAHTDGDTFVHFPESDVLHLGDVFRTTSYPIIDVYNGGTLAGTIEALDLAIGLAGPDTKVIPGHGVNVVGRRELIEFRDMTVAVSQRVRALIAEGKTLDEVMQARPTAAYDKKWGTVPSWTANDFVPIVYHQLGGGSLYEQ